MSSKGTAWGAELRGRVKSKDGQKTRHVTFGGGSGEEALKRSKRALLKVLNWAWKETARDGGAKNTIDLKAMLEAKWPNPASSSG